VLYVDPDPEHRALARDFGGHHRRDPGTLPQSYDIAVEATGRVDQLALALKCLTPEGICESAGNHFRPGELPLLDMYLTGVTLRVARDSVRAHIPDALALAASGKVAPGKVVSHVIDWEDLPAALPENTFVRAGATDRS
jgi:alcohol dehydrogenase